VARNGAGGIHRSASRQERFGRGNILQDEDRFAHHGQSLRADLIDRNPANARARS